MREATAQHRPCRGVMKGPANRQMQVFVKKKWLPAVCFSFFKEAKCSPDFLGGGGWRNLY